MTARTQALVKELAALFVKYSLADWAPLTDPLSAAGRDDLADAVRDLASTPRAPARKAKVKARPGAKSKSNSAPKPGQTGIVVSEDRARYLTPLYRALKAREAAPSAADIRELYLSIGIKQPYPKRREDVVDAIVQELDRLPDAQFLKSLKRIAKDDEHSAKSGDDYGRWFNLILETKR